jgi:hypothetical protein
MRVMREYTISRPLCTAVEAEEVAAFAEELRITVPVDSDFITSLRRSTKMKKLSLRDAPLDDDAFNAVHRLFAPGPENQFLNKIETVIMPRYPIARAIKMEDSADEDDMSRCSYRLRFCSQGKGEDRQIEVECWSNPGSIRKPGAGTVDYHHVCSMSMTRNFIQAMRGTVEFTHIEAFRPRANNQGSPRWYPGLLAHLSPDPEAHKIKVAEICLKTMMFRYARAELRKDVNLLDKSSLKVLRLKGCVGIENVLRLLTRSELSLKTLQILDPHPPETKESPQELARYIVRLHTLRKFKFIVAHCWNIDMAVALKNAQQIRSLRIRVGTSRMAPAELQRLISMCPGLVSVGFPSSLLNQPLKRGRTTNKERVFLAEYARVLIQAPRLEKLRFLMSPFRAADLPATYHYSNWKAASNVFHTVIEEEKTRAVQDEPRIENIRFNISMPCTAWGDRSGPYVEQVPFRRKFRYN